MTDWQFVPRENNLGLCPGLILLLSEDSDGRLSYQTGMWLGTAGELYFRNNFQNYNFIDLLTLNILLHKFDLPEVPEKLMDKFLDLIRYYS